MLIPREGSLRLAASGSLRIVCEPSTVNVAWNLIFGITLQTCGRRSARSRSRCQSRSNCTVTVTLLVKVNRQVVAGGSVVGHGAVQPVRSEVEPGIAVSVTEVPGW